MSNLNNNPLAWAGIVVVIGLFAINGEWLDGFVVLALAVIVSKLVEIIFRLDKHK